MITIDAVPFTRLAKPLAESRIALITTAGLHFDDQPPFDRLNGDCSYRRIGAGTELAHLRVDHQPFASRDINCAFPLPLLREICDVAETHYSFSGAIPDPRPLLSDTAPRVARELRADAVVIAPS